MLELAYLREKMHLYSEFKIALAMSGRAEYNRWKPYLQLLTSPNTPAKLKESILEKCPIEVIYAIEEILINVKVSI